jgi:hypothetical protein
MTQISIQTEPTAHNMMSPPAAAAKKVGLKRESSFIEFNKKQ